MFNLNIDYNNINFIENTEMLISDQQNVYNTNSG